MIEYNGSDLALPLEVAVEESVVHHGLTKLEWFAGQAFAVVANYPALTSRRAIDKLDDESGVAETVAAWAFEIADAMIRESAKRK